MDKAPILDKRSHEAFFQEMAMELKRRLGVDVQGDDRMAEALLRVFSRYCELMVERVNKVPDKNRDTFLDLLGVSRIPPVSAEVPLTFTPVKKLPAGRGPIVVPAFTKVAAPPPEGETEPVVFETSQDLFLTAVELKKAISHDPQRDLYTDRSSLLEGGEGGFPFSGELPVVHEFFIGHGAIFGKPGITELRFRFEMAPARSRSPQEIQWWIPAEDKEFSLTPVRDTTAQLTRSGEVVFRDLPSFPPMTFSGRSDHWIGCRLKNRLPAPDNDGSAAYRPVEIAAATIEATWRMEAANVENAAFNNIPIDISKDFFPFGERPRFGDVFLLNLPDSLEPQTLVSLSVTLTNPASAAKEGPLPPVNAKGKPVIVWEYRAKHRWMSLSCEDETCALAESGKVSFRMPDGIAFSTVGGVEGSWIRARLVSGHYGQDANIGFSEALQAYSATPSTLAPPCVREITAALSRTAGPQSPHRIETVNNFRLKSMEGGAPFKPFTPARDPEMALYLGFKAPNDDAGPLAASGLDLYFHMMGSEDRPFSASGRGEKSPHLFWQVWGGSRWTTVRAFDATEAFTTPGIVRIRFQAGVSPSLWTSTSLGGGLFWLRVMWRDGHYQCRPRLCRVMLNTAAAVQTATLHGEILGSGSGRPHQVFRTARRPILRDLELTVMEPEIPTKQEQERLRISPGEDGVTVIRNPEGRIEKIWVPWQEVDDFFSSGADDRHFTVDRQGGEIRFGDGVRGRIPQAGTNNLVLRRYGTGGGRSGNRPAGSITQLQTSVAYVDAVVNLEQASGGQEMESIESLRERGARAIRHRQRAVTFEDYEDLARLASPVITKVKCYPNRDLVLDPSGARERGGVVSLVVVPAGEGSRPSPDLALLKHIRRYLDERRAPDAAVVILGPEYVKVSLAVSLAPVSFSTGADVAGLCHEALTAYLHPLRGGRKASGWKFGERPHESKIYAVLEGVPGVSHVRSLHMSLQEARPGLLDSGIFLVCSGEHDIRLDG